MKHIKHINIFASLLLFISFMTISCSNLFDSLAQVKINYYSEIGAKSIPPTKGVESNYSLGSSDIPDLEAVGYQFDGWYIGDTHITTGYTVTRDITLEAMWTANKYTIKFDTEGLEGKLEPIECKYGKKGNLPPNTLSKPNCNFLGWNTKKDGTGIPIADKGEYYNLTSENNGVVTLYPQWSNSASVTVYYANEKGESPKPISKGIGSKLAMEDLLRLPDFNDYKFIGWYNGTSLVSVGTVVETNMILVAHWQQVGTVSEVMFEKFGEVDLNETVRLYCPTKGAKIHYTTDGKEPTIDSPIYDNPILITKDMTIKAYAESTTVGFDDSAVTSSALTVKTYTVTFNGNGIENPTFGKTFKKGESLSVEDLPKVDNSYSNHKFLGWYYNGAKVENPLEISSNIVLVAQWQEIGKVADVIFENSGAVDFNDTVKLICPTEGALVYYTTDGKTTPTASSNLYKEPIVISKDMTIKAIAIKTGLKDSNVVSSKYTVKTYTVSFNGNGIENPTINKTFKKGESLLVEDLPNVDNSFVNHKFLGWYYNGAKVESSLPISSNIVLVAQWQEIGTVADVMFDKKGNVDFKDTVTLTTYPSDAKIYYTTDGKDPTTSSTLYKGPIEITKDCTIKAIAMKDGLKSSHITSVDYKLKLYNVIYADDLQKCPDPEIPTYKKGETITVKEAPSHDGYKFLGWYLDGIKIDIGKTLVITKNITLVAKWEKINKTDKPVFSVTGGPIDYKQKITLTSTDAQIYYTTDGNEPSALSTLYDASNGIEIDDPNGMTIKAFAIKDGFVKSDVVENTYTIKTYSVTFAGNGVKNPAPFPNLKATDKFNTSNLPEVFRTGYDFLGWYYDGKKYSKEVPEDIVITHDIVFDAQWQEFGKVADVLIYPKADNSTNPTYVDNDTQIVLTCPTDGAQIYYTTDGSDPITNGITYSEQSNIKISNTNENAKIRAYAKKMGLKDSNISESVYSIKTYSVNFYTNGADGCTPVITKTGFKKGDKLGEDIATEQNNLAKEYHIFDGWYDSNGIKIDDLANYVVQENTTFIAKWTLCKVSDVQIKGGIGNKIKYDGQIELICSDSDADIYYTFGNTKFPENWEKYDNISKILIHRITDFTIRSIAIKDGFKNSNEQSHFYTIDLPIVTFNLNNSALTSQNILNWSDSMKNLIGTELPIIEDKNKTFKFEGWYDAISNGNRVTKIPDKSCNVYAKWSLEKPLFEKQSGDEIQQYITPIKVSNYNPKVKTLYEMSSTTSSTPSKNYISEGIKLESLEKNILTVKFEWNGTSTSNSITYNNLKKSFSLSYLTGDYKNDSLLPTVPSDLINVKEGSEKVIGNAIFAGIGELTAENGQYVLNHWNNSNTNAPATEEDQIDSNIGLIAIWDKVSEPIYPKSTDVIAFFESNITYAPLNKSTDPKVPNPEIYYAFDPTTLEDFKSAIKTNNFTNIKKVDSSNNIIIENPETLSYTIYATVKNGFAYSNVYTFTLKVTKKNLENPLAIAESNTISKDHNRTSLLRGEPVKFEINNPKLINGTIRWRAIPWNGELSDKSNANEITEDFDPITGLTESKETFITPAEDTILKIGIVQNGILIKVRTLFINIIKLETLNKPNFSELHVKESELELGGGKTVYITGIPGCEIYYQLGTGQAPDLNSPNCKLYDPNVGVPNVKPNTKISAVMVNKYDKTQVSLHNWGTMVSTVILRRPEWNSGTELEIGEKVILEWKFNTQVVGHMYWASGASFDDISDDVHTYTDQGVNNYYRYSESAPAVKYAFITDEGKVITDIYKVLFTTRTTPQKNVSVQLPKFKAITYTGRTPLNIIKDDAKTDTQGIPGANDQFYTPGYIYKKIENRPNNMVMLTMDEPYIGLGKLYISLTRPSNNRVPNIYDIFLNKEDSLYDERNTYVYIYYKDRIISDVLVITDTKK